MNDVVQSVIKEAKTLAADLLKKAGDDAVALLKIAAGDLEAAASKIAPEVADLIIEFVPGQFAQYVKPFLDAAVLAGAKAVVPAIDARIAQGLALAIARIDAITGSTAK